VERAGVRRQGQPRFLNERDRMTEPTEKRSIFITGAASGIGRETARLFAARGFRVGIYDIDEELLRMLADEIGSSKCLAARLDVRDSGACNRAMAGFRAWTGGRMDVLFSCAGVMRMGRFAEIPVEEHVRMVEVNAVGTVVVIHAALDLLRATPGSRILTMGSAAGIYGVPELATYSASKFFVRGLTEALNLELEKDGIVVSDLMPLYVDTPMIRSQSYRAGTLKTFGSKLTPQQIAELAWKAVHEGPKVHWVPGPMLKAMGFVRGALPFLARPTMKLVGLRRR
jgi:short-subunit dehydrogenase